MISFSSSSKISPTISDLKFFFPGEKFGNVRSTLKSKPKKSQTFKQLAFQIAKKSIKHKAWLMSLSMSDYHQIVINAEKLNFNWDAKNGRIFQQSRFYDLNELQIKFLLTKPHFFSVEISDSVSRKN